MSAEAVERRMSVRAFKPDPVDGAVVRQILDRAARAPSGGNLQPWRVHALSPANRWRRFKATDRNSASPRPTRPEYDVYPANLWEPYCAAAASRSARTCTPRSAFRARTRSPGCNAVRDATARLLRRASSSCSSRSTAAWGPPQWSDLGMYMQTVMLLAVEQGLDTCAQEFWSPVRQDHRRRVGTCPKDHMVFSGMALGYRDEAAP
jgi:nitroreductase